jgi:hypothetical protein
MYIVILSEGNLFLILLMKYYDMGKGKSHRILFHQIVFFYSVILIW